MLRMVYLLGFSSSPWNGSCRPPILHYEAEAPSVKWHVHITVTQHKNWEYTSGFLTFRLAFCSHNALSSSDWGSYPKFAAPEPSCLFRAGVSGLPASADTQVRCAPVWIWLASAQVTALSHSFILSWKQMILEFIAGIRTMFSMSWT